jgi:hypothetical protein
VAPQRLASLPLGNPRATALEIAAAVGSAAGGTSGVLYQIFFTAAAGEGRGQPRNTTSCTHERRDSRL